MATWCSLNVNDNNNIIAYIFIKGLIKSSAGSALNRVFQQNEYIKGIRQMSTQKGVENE